MAEIGSLFDLQGRVAVVTGGSRGLGLEMAEGLGQAGARVMISGRRQPWLDQAAAALREGGIQARGFLGSVTEPAEVEALVEACVTAFGRVDILVNSAGISWGAPTLEMPAAQFRRVMDTNATGTFLVSQAAARQMVRQGEGGRIINIASLAGIVGTNPARLSAVGYSASKAAVVGLTRTLAVHLAGYGINVNAIAPGFFPTRMTEGLLASVGEERMGRDTPLGRIGRPGELKGACVFLAAPASAYITGQVIAVDGGASVW